MSHADPGRPRPAAASLSKLLSLAPLLCKRRAATCPGAEVTRRAPSAAPAPSSAARPDRWAPSPGKPRSAGLRAQRDPGSWRPRATAAALRSCLTPAVPASPFLRGSPPLLLFLRKRGAP
ncbi:unnamed protein product [Rangifer tarandus platyrhynchus]|uniref:Uncharacterized protein n=1 Tax=Rangifer tarandus platyrhynchus TaxID=3082113 RepID=A0AC60A642_RANTA